jgi:hypothetical protein
MALALSGTSNGSLNNLSLSGNTATIVDTGRAGGIIQVVQATTTTEVTVNTTTFTDTTLSASITPSSSTNKILVMVMQSCVNTRSSSAVGHGIRLLRDSTVVWTPQESPTGPFMWYGNPSGISSNELDGTFHVNYLDSPSTTSSVTYKTQGRPHTNSDSGVVYYQYTTTNYTTQVSTMILMEVVA